MAPVTGIGAAKELLIAVCLAGCFFGLLRGFLVDGKSLFSVELFLCYQMS